MGDTMGFIDDFREFAVKGNVIDMAVGIVLGVAFNKVVTSLVNDVFMPPLGYMIGGVEFKHLAVVLRPATMDASGIESPEVAIRYGMFINTVIEYIIIALAAFIVIKALSRVIRARERATA
jgi:large conductance mechanosensitive channel